MTLRSRGPCAAAAQCECPEAADVAMLDSRRAHDSALFAAGDGPHLVRREPLRDLAAGRDRGHRGAGRARRGARRRRSPPSGRRPASTSRASTPSSARSSTTSSPSCPTWPRTSGPRGAGCTTGLTSSDVVDTALALLMREACDLILEDVRRAVARPSAERAFEYKHAPMIGRTHGVHAEPMTFGLKLALWYAELQRDLARLERARDDDLGGQALGGGGHVLAPAARGRGGGLPAPRAHARPRSRRRSCSATATPR